MVFLGIINALECSGLAQTHYFFDLNLYEIFAVYHFWVWAYWSHDQWTLSWQALLLTQISELIQELAYYYL